MWSHQNERTGTAQLYTSSRAVHCVIFVTLALTAGKEILSELFMKQIHAQHIHYQMDKDDKSFMKKNKQTKKTMSYYSRTVKSTVVLLA